MISVWLASFQRVGQEALNNVVKHAHVRHVTIWLAQRESSIRLVIIDDGRGFDPVGSYPGQIGLSSMRERAERAGGRLEIESAPGKGAQIRVDIPYK